MGLRLPPRMNRVAVTRTHTFGDNSRIGIDPFLHRDGDFRTHSVREGIVVIP